MTPLVGEVDQSVWQSVVSSSQNANGMTVVTYNFNATLNFSLLTGRQTTTTTVTGLLTTDRILEVQPTTDLPGNLTIGYAFISAADTIKIAFTTPVIYTGNTVNGLRVTVLRANP